MVSMLSIAEQTFSTSFIFTMKKWAFDVVSTRLQRKYSIYELVNGIANKQIEWKRHNQSNGRTHLLKLHKSRPVNTTEMEENAHPTDTNEYLNVKTINNA